MSNSEIKEKALAYLRGEKTAVVATVSPKGEPEAATLYYAIDDDFTFNFVTRDTSRKFQNLKNDSRMAVVVGTGPDLITIHCGGEAERIDYESDTARAEEVIRKVFANTGLRKSKDFPIMVFPKSQFGIFRVKPKWMVWLNLEAEKYPEAYASDYQVVIP